MKQLTIFAVFLIALTASLAVAQEPQPAKEEPKKEQPAEQPKPEAEKPEDADKPREGQPSAEDVLKELLKRRAENPLNEPKAQKPGTPAEEPPAKSEESTKPVGSSPVAIRKPITNRGEGTLIVTRRGRLTKSSDPASQWVFTFDADTQGLNDAPVHLMPCKALEEAEASLQKQGAETAPMIVSGQVYVYKGKSFLLPSVLRPSFNRGNLQP